MAAAILAMALGAAASAKAASSVIQYGPAPAWVGPPPTATGAAPPEGAAVQVIYTDNQVRLGSQGDEFYTAYRLKILKPEALPLGNVAATWSPDTDDIHVHGLKIIRGDRTIDVLKTTKFAVVQRENNLEYSMLDGDLTATLQAPGLQVGDELEFATTLRRRDPTLDGRSQGAMMLPTMGAPGAYRMRLVWPKTRTLRWRVTPDVGELEPAGIGGDYVLSYELRDPKTAITADGAPVPVNLRRFLEFSSFSSWSDVSSLIWPLYEQASTLAPGSPVRAEAARIAASTTDPAARAAAALRLVQERIRYVYVDLNGGNYQPASADETWTRRFGDCKAKTVLLLALLRELGVPAEAALVHSQGGDGSNERLPALGAFDHVLVRATIDGRSYWLDGTRLGDRKLDLLPPPAFRWALPVRKASAELVAVEPQGPLLALNGVMLEVDASAGFDAPAKVSAEQVLRGDEALVFKTSLAQMSRDDAERALKAYWMESYDWVEPEAVAWRYDEDQNMTVLTMSGEGEPEWEGDAEDGRWLDIYGAGFYKPEELRRPKEQDQNAPWVTNFPAYKRWTTIIRLPPETDGWAWGYRASQVNEQIAGVAYVRDAELHNGVLRTTLSRRTFKPEITAEEAREANKLRTDFDNKVSRVYQYEAPEKADMDARMARASAEAGKDPGKLSAIGGYLIGEGDYDRAAKFFDKALAADKAYRPAIEGKVLALERQDRHAELVRFLDAVLKTAPAPDLSLARGLALFKMGKTEEGTAAMEAVLAANPTDVGLVAGFVQAAHEAGLNDRALAAAEAGLKLDPDDLYLRQVRASLYALEDRWAQALPDLEAAVRLQPEEPVNLRNRANALRQLGQADQALADLDEAMRMDPLDLVTVGAKARALRLVGRREEAVALYDVMVERNRNGMTLNNRCWERALLDLQLAEAEADCAEAVKLDPKQPAYWDSYGVVALRMDRPGEALRRFDQALALKPEWAPALYGRGLAKLRQGDEAGGRADIAAAIALRPTVGEELTKAGITP